MKTVGIIGGLSPESTSTYYQGLNQGVRDRLGGSHNAKIIINSLDFGEFVSLKQVGDWESQSKILCDAAQSLERAGADFIVLATNTMHKMADDIISVLNIPFLHLADATAEKIKNTGIEAVGLLGTRYTMEQDFYKGRLIDHALNVLLPDQDGIEDVHRIIYDELCNGKVLYQSKSRYQNVIKVMEQQGAQGVILGCTEIGMLIKPEDVDITVFDTTNIHILAALNMIFEE